MSCKPVSKERLEYARDVLWGGSPESETLDKLYLEWSQFTQAKTAREIQLESQLDAVREIVDTLPRFKLYDKLQAALNGEGDG